MRIKGKAFLIGLLAAVFSVTGVFSAWVFHEGNDYLEGDSQEVDLEVDELEDWEFDYYRVTFDANSGVPTGYTGLLANGNTTAEFFVKPGSCVSYEDFLSEVGMPKLVDSNGKYCTDRVFARWLADGGSVFDTTTQINRDIIIRPTYMSVAGNAVIYKSNDTTFSEPLCAMYYDTELGGGEEEEYYITDFFLVDSLKRDYHYVVRFDNHIYSTLSIEYGYEGIDFVTPGFYYVAFTPYEPYYGTENYNPFGGYCWFKKQYRWVVVGNPNNGWTAKSNSPVFACGTSYNNNFIEHKTYVAKKVRFYDSGDYRFRIVDPQSNIVSHTSKGESSLCPQIYLGTSAKNYVTIEGDYIALKETTTYRKFDIEITVMYGDAGILNGEYQPFGYPTSIDVYMTPIG